MAEVTPPTELDPFDQILAALKQTLIDIDGDGRPDAVVERRGSTAQVRPLDSLQSRSDFPADTNRMLDVHTDRAQPLSNAHTPEWITGPNRFANTRQPEMRSFQPSAGDDARVGVNRLLEAALGPETSQRIGSTAGALLDYGPMPARFAADVALQPARAGEAVAQAAIDPTLSNVTNAGLQTGMAVARPAVALGSLGLGYAEALRRDLGIGATTPAEAQTKGRAQPQATFQLPGLTSDQNSAYQDAARRISEGNFRTPAERRMLENTINDLRGLSVRSVEREGDRAGELDTQRKLAEQGEYNRTVERAEAARDAELGRKRRFSDTAVGKLYNDMGGASAVLAAAAAGGAHNWASGGKTDFANKILWPALEGTGASFAAMNLPLVYDAFATDTDNPEKAAYSAYSRELPPNHPRKQEFADFARELPAENPVRKAASDDFYGNMGKRIGMAAIEGVPSALTGANLDRIRQRGVNVMTRGSAEPENKLLSALADQGAKPRQAAAAEAQSQASQLEKQVVFKGRDKLGRTFHADHLGRRVSSPD